MQSRPLPDVSNVREIIESLIGRGVNVKSIGRLAFSPKSVCVIAIYVNDDGSLRAFCLADLQFAAYASAALTMIPAQDANDSVKSGALSEILRENLGQIFNIFTQLFNMDGTPPAQLKGMFLDIANAPAQLKKMLTSIQNRMDVEISIEEYGTGRMTIMAP